MAINYRPEVDGLRAVAVVIVLLFHLQVPRFDGGFVGVDVFFVISGFLISGILWDQITHQSFDFLKFMGRRARRLLPASLVIIGATFVVGSFLFSPETFSSLSVSSIAATFGLSNIRFLFQAGYFDAGARMKPLLHTWSLGVEWQFYVVWPFMLYGIWRIREQIHPLVSIMVIAALSLALNVAFSSDTAALYYNPVFRVFEFCIGGGLAISSARSKLPAFVASIVSVIGLFAIAYAAHYYNQTTVFPSVAALLPCGGAVLLIWVGADSIIGKILSLRPVVWTGKASYSIYLFHWPLIIYSEMIWPDHALPMKIALFVLSFVGGGLLYVCVERPLHRGPLTLPLYQFVPASIVAMALIVAPATGAVGGNGWPWRMSPQIRQIIAVADEDIQNRHAYFLGKGCFTNSTEGNYFTDFDFATCMTHSATKRNVLLIGDSFAAYSYPGIAAAAGPSVNVMQNTLIGCTPIIGFDRGINCKRRNEDLFTHFSKYRSDLIILMAHWYPYNVDAIRKTLEFMKEKHQPVILIGPTLNFQKELIDIVSSYRTVPLAEAGAVDFLNSGPFALDKTMRVVAAKYGASYYSPIQQLCPGGKREDCKVIIGGKTILTWDAWHLTHNAAKYVFRHLELQKAWAKAPTS